MEAKKADETASAAQAAKCELLHLLIGLVGCASVWQRRLVCTPFDGKYGHAGWVIVVNGSPPRGMLVAKDPTDGWVYPVTFIGGGPPVALTRVQVDIVQKFIATCLADTREPVEL